MLDPSLTLKVDFSCLLLYPPDASGGYYGFRFVTPPPQCGEKIGVNALQAAIFELAFLNFLGMFLVKWTSLGITLGPFQKTKWPPEPFLCRKMPFFRQLVLLTCKSNLSIINILDRYKHLLYTCEPLTLRLFLEGRPGGVKVPHRGNYVIGCVSSLIIGPRGLGCIGSL